MTELTRERFENAEAYAGRLLASIFEEIYAPREMPDDIRDRVMDICSLLTEAVGERYHVVYK